VQILTQKALADEGLGDAYLVPIIKKKVEALRITSSTSLSRSYVC
jgi:hypothetical protein